MRQQGGGEPACIVVNHGAFGYAIVAGFMVFKTEVRRMVAQGQEEMIFAIMPRPVERSGFGDQALVLVDGRLRHLQCRFAVGHFVNVVLDRALRRERNAAEVRPGQHWRIHQRGQRHLLEIDLARGLARHGQRRSKMPARRQLQ